MGLLWVFFVAFANFSGCRYCCICFFSFITFLFSSMISKQPSVRGPTGGGTPPVTGFYWNLFLNNNSTSCSLTYCSNVDVGHSYTCRDYLRDTYGGTAFNTLKQFTQDKTWYIFKNTCFNQKKFTQKHKHFTTTNSFLDRRRRLLKQLQSQAALEREAVVKNSTHDVMNTDLNIWGIKESFTNPKPLHAKRVVITIGKFIHHPRNIA